MTVELGAVDDFEEIEVAGIPYFDALIAAGGGEELPAGLKGDVIDGEPMSGLAKDPFVVVLQVPGFEVGIAAAAEQVAAIGRVGEAEDRVVMGLVKDLSDFQGAGIKEVDVIVAGAYGDLVAGSIVAEAAQRIIAQLVTFEGAAGLDRPATEQPAAAGGQQLAVQFQHTKQAFSVVGNIMRILNIGEVYPVEATVHITNGQLSSVCQIVQRKNIAVDFGDEPPGVRIIEVPFNHPTIPCAREKMALIFGEKGVDGRLVATELDDFFDLDFSAHGVGLFLVKIRYFWGLCLYSIIKYSPRRRNWEFG